MPHYYRFSAVPILLRLLLLSGWLASPTVAAQRVPVVSTPTRIGGVRDRADTLQAVAHLFARRRKGGSFWLVGGAVAAARIGSIALLSGDRSGVLVGTAALGGIPAAIGLGKRARFSAAREQAVCADYARGQPLPKPIRRRLRPKDF